MSQKLASSAQEARANKGGAVVKSLLEAFILNSDISTRDGHRAIRRPARQKSRPTFLWQTTCPDTLRA
jgi:hypothetical protein